MVSELRFGKPWECSTILKKKKILVFCFSSEDLIIGKCAQRRHGGGAKLGIGVGEGERGSEGRRREKGGLMG